MTEGVIDLSDLHRVERAIERMYDKRGTGSFNAYEHKHYLFLIELEGELRTQLGLTCGLQAQPTYT